MNNRIKTKIYNAFNKYNTDCIIVTYCSAIDYSEKRGLIMRTETNELNLIRHTGMVFSLDWCDLLYVRDIQDVAYEKIFNKENNYD